MRGPGRRTRPGQPVRPGRTDAFELAAGWYAALPSGALSRPRALDLFGRQLVAWRDGAGRPAVMARHCPHLSASLAQGKVVDGQLRCPFHHWRFDGDGACVRVPGVKRIPASAHRRPYPVTERYGLVWVWYGGGEPLYALPEFPALEAERGRYLAYGFCHSTPAPPRRILENAFDFQHFATLHGVRSADGLTLSLLDRPEEAEENGPPIAAEAWMGARLQVRALRLPRALTAVGVEGKGFGLLVDGWPGGQRLTFFLDGAVIAKELLAITPVARDRTVFRGWSLVRRTHRPWRDVPAYVVYRAQHALGTREDLAVYRNACDDPRGGAPVAYDRSVLRFRRHYRDWVARAEEAERTGGVAT